MSIDCISTCFVSGTATSNAGYIYYSGGCTLAVNNTYKVKPVLVLKIRKKHSKVHINRPYKGNETF